MHPIIDDQRVVDLRALRHGTTRRNPHNCRINFQHRSLIQERLKACNFILNSLGLLRFIIPLFP